MKGLDTEGKDVDEILEEVVSARRTSTDPKDMFGGPRDWVDSMLPGLVVVVVVLYAKQPLRTGAYLALGAVAILVAVRLVRRETLRHALSGVFGVGLSVLVMWAVGDVKGYFLPGIFINIGYGAIFLVSVLAKHPLVGVILRTFDEKPKEWHEHPVVKRAYNEATLIWAGMFFLRVLVKGSLYEADKTTLLAIAHFAMGYPLYLGLLGLTLPFVRKRTRDVPLPQGQPETGGEDTEDNAAEAVADGSGA